MNTIKRIVALVLATLLVVSVGVISAFAAQPDVADTSANGITIYFESEDKVPYVYYWNALPTDLETAYPGVKMTKEQLLALNAELNKIPKPEKKGLFGIFKK